ncbi:DinB family protein [Gilvibacter sp.]|uniref:DinB family protein n=1 Tax=Gilvibacter sp. TaxID=2729997 RepID=UPI003F4A1B93
MTNPIAKNLANQIRQVHTGGNWTAVNIKDTLADVDLALALKKKDGYNTIATLVFHINYFYEVVIPVMKGGPLNGKDALSFDHPPLNTEAEWQAMIQNSLQQGETLAALMEEFPDEKLGSDFVDPKYGTYYRNFSGLVEHTHYHLGQIVMLKKMLA